MAILIYTDSKQCAGQRKGTIFAMRDMATQQKKNGHITRWALFYEYHPKTNAPFHNSTDRDYLIAHDDPYWATRDAAEGLNEVWDHGLHGDSVIKVLS